MPSCDRAQGRVFNWEKGMGSEGEEGGKEQKKGRGGQSLWLKGGIADTQRPNSQNPRQTRVPTDHACVLPDPQGQASTGA